MRNLALPTAVAFGHILFFCSRATAFDNVAYSRIQTDLAEARSDNVIKEVYQRVHSNPHCDFDPNEQRLVSDMEERVSRAFPGGPYSEGKTTMLREESAQPGVPPPVWNNLPLPCLPIPKGHSCFGAVSYPITFADFVLSDVTTTAIDAATASFPALFLKRVGKAPDAVYNKCYHAYMSLQCASLFPMCTAIQGRDEPIPGIGKMPVCNSLCSNVLMQCPGFRVDDISGECDAMASPPTCSAAYHTREDNMPPQYSTYDEYDGFPTTCPQVES